MPERHEDWLKQAKRDLSHADRALADGHFEWACFAAQQAAEKAVKALYQKMGADAWGHSVFALLGQLPEGRRPDPSLVEAGKELDKHYIPPRYPNAYPQGAPFEYYTKGEAERAIEHAEHILAFCQDQMA